MKSRFGRMAPCPQERKLGVLAGGFESSRSFPTSQPPHPKSFPRPKTVSKSRPGRPMFAHLSSLRRPSQLPDRFLMRRPPSEDGFLFTSSRFGLLRSGVLAGRFPCGPHLAPWLSSVLRLCSTWRGKLGVLAGGFESGRSFPASQPPHPKSFARPKTVSKSRPVQLMLAHLLFLRRPGQLPDSLPDASSAVRGRFSFHQFPVRIAPFRRP